MVTYESQRQVLCGVFSLTILMRRAEGYKCLIEYLANIMVHIKSSLFVLCICQYTSIWYNASFCAGLLHLTSLILLKLQILMIHCTLFSILQTCIYLTSKLILFKIISGDHNDALHILNHI